MIKVTIIPILKDNYAYLLEAQSGETAIVDPGEAGPIIDVLEKKELGLTFILNTHHHGDHIAGNKELKEKYSAKIIGPEKDAHRIEEMDIGLHEDDNFTFGEEIVQVFETPGHTLGGICFHFPGSKIAFTGDALFAMSCGRLFEGTAAQMWNSLEKIMALPDETQLYCGHEYTQDNGRFCLTIEPDNPDLITRMKDVDTLRTEGKPTMPFTVELEKKTNAFIRAGSAARFAEIRELKDNF